MVERISVATGYDYVRLDATETAASEGAVLINGRGELQGMLMPPPRLQRNEIGNPGEAFAIEASAVARVALPLLRTGHTNTQNGYPGWSSVAMPASGQDPNLTHAKPPLLQSRAELMRVPLQPTQPQRRPPSYTWPLIVGHATLEGRDAPVGSVLHARLSKEDQPDYWVFAELTEVGFFTLYVSVPNPNYSEATIEFWMDCRRSATTTVLDFSPAGRRNLNLAF